MLAQLVSDLHTEYRPEALAALPGWRHPDADLLIMAGDICNIDERSLNAVIDAVAGWKQVLYVPGNHEFYGSSPRDAERTMAGTLRCRFGTVHDDRFRVAMRPQFFEFNKVRFAAGTMWYRRADVARLPGAVPDAGRWHVRSEGRYRTFMDFKATEGLAPFCYEQSAEFEKMLRANLCTTDVVVTHHLPSPRSTPLEFQGELDNCFFCCNQEDVIVHHQPAAWLHGHTHSPFDYHLNRTRVVSNPLGYRNERRVEDYRPALIEL